MRTLTQGPYSTGSAKKGIGCAFLATDRGVGEITNKPLAVTRELLTSHQQCSRYIFLQPQDILSSPMKPKKPSLEPAHWNLDITKGQGTGKICSS